MGLSDVFRGIRLGLHLDRNRSPSAALTVSGAADLYVLGSPGYPAYLHRCGFLFGRSYRECFVPHALMVLASRGRRDPIHLTYHATSALINARSRIAVEGRRGRAARCAA